MEPWPARITLEELSAFLDEELPPDRAAEIAMAISQDAELGDRLKHYEDQIAAIRSLYENIVHDPMPRNLVAAVNRIQSRRNMP